MRPIICVPLILRPHIYLIHGRWTCASLSGGWAVFPYGKGDTPLDAYCDWLQLKFAIRAEEV